MKFLSLFKEKKSNIVKMHFDEYFIDVITRTMTYWYAVNYKKQTAILVIYYENEIINYQISWTSIESAEGKKEITKHQFLEAYDRALDYLKNSRP